MESPLFVDILLYTIYGLLALSVGLAVWSMVRNVRRQGLGEKKSNGIPARLIILTTIGLLSATLLLTWLLASTHPLTINGQVFDSQFWLRMSDMLINTSLILIVVATLCATLGLLGIGRRIKQ